MWIALAKRQGQWPLLG